MLPWYFFLSFVCSMGCGEWRPHSIRMVVKQIIQWLFRIATNPLLLWQQSSKWANCLYQHNTIIKIYHQELKKSNNKNASQDDHHSQETKLQDSTFTAFAQPHHDDEPDDRLDCWLQQSRGAHAIRPNQGPHWWAEEQVQQAPDMQFYVDSLRATARWREPLFGEFETNSSICNCSYRPIQRWQLTHQLLSNIHPIRQPPVDPDPWQNLDALTKRVMCPQVEQRFRIQTSIRAEPIIESEDCLYLNVFVPVDVSRTLKHDSMSGGVSRIEREIDASTQPISPWCGWSGIDRSWFVVIIAQHSQLTTSRHAPKWIPIDVVVYDPSPSDWPAERNDYQCSAQHP